MIDSRQHPSYFAFASKQLGEEFLPGDSCKCLANVREDGYIRAVVLYAQPTEFNCMMHVASDGSRRWLSKEFLFWAFYVPFIQWKKARVTGLVRSDNEAALRFDESLGFRKEGVMRNAFGDKDAILIGMLKDECRHLHIKVK